MAPLRALARSATALRGPRAREAVLWALAGLALLTIFGPALRDHRRLALEPGVFNDDARQQIYPFFRYEDPSLFPADHAGDYYLACLPIGFRALYTAAALGPGAEPLSDALPYLLLALTAVALGAAAYRLGGKAAAFTAAALCLGAGSFLDRMAGGLPRGFGFPIAACALAALVWGRSRLLAVVVVAGAGFYPAAAVPAGLALAAWMLLPARDRGDAAGWSLGRRTALVGGTALASVLLLTPPLLQARTYGPTIRPADLAEFPEAGPGGRYGDADRPPYGSFVKRLRGLLENGLRGRGEPWSETTREWWRRHPTAGRAMLWGLLAITGLGWLRLILLRPAARRASLFPVAAVLAYAAAKAVPPLLYLPERYVLFPMLPFAVLLVAAGAAGLVPATAGARRRWLRPAVVGAFCVLALALLGGRGSRSVGLDVEVDPGAAVYRFLRTLPPDALIAGWPTGLVDSVPYVARRQALVTYETHQAFHARYTLEMRRRMRALVDAYLAPAPGDGPEPLRKLHRELGVSHLVIGMPALRARQLRYFEPFDADIDRALRVSHGLRLAVLEAPLETVVFDDGRYRVLDLRRLADAAGGPAGDPAGEPG